MEQQTPQSPSKYLRDLADKIDKNAVEDFGGCFCIIMPGAKEPLSGLFIGKVDPLALFTLMKTKIDVLVAEIDAASKQQNFGRR